MHYHAPSVLQGLYFSSENGFQCNTLNFILININLYVNCTILLTFKNPQNA
jgi:hypothetical protein